MTIQQDPPASRIAPAASVWRNASGATRLIAGVLITLAFLSLVWRTHPGPAQNPRDFETLYAGAFCLTRHCNPYDVDVLNTVLLAHNVVPSGHWVDNMPIYPPTTMTLIAPFSFLPFKVANLLWYGINLFAYTAAITWLLLGFEGLRSVAMPLRVAALLLLLVFPKAVWSLDLGNPNLLVTSLLIFVVFDAGPSRYTLRLILFVMACLLKPQLAMPFLLLLVLDESRRSLRSLSIMLASLVALCGAVFLYASRYPATTSWRMDIARNLHMATAPGMSMDPTVKVNGGNALLNLQYLFGYWIDRGSVSQALSLLLFALLTATLLHSLWKRYSIQIEPTTNLYLLATATLASLVLLPVYHRFYDGAILILTIPWILRNLPNRPRINGAVVAAMLMAVLYKNWLGRLAIPRAGGAVSMLEGFFQSRYEARSPSCC
jgi:Glycosyltransferase family 87